MRGWLAGSLLVFFGMAAIASVGVGALPPPGDSGDTGFDTGDTGDTGDTATDTGDSGQTDTADTAAPEDTAGPRYSAAQRAGEKGGFTCATAGTTGSAALVWGGVLLLAARRTRRG